MIPRAGSRLGSPKNSVSSDGFLSRRGSFTSTRSPIAKQPLIKDDESDIFASLSHYQSIKKPPPLPITTNENEIDDLVQRVEHRASVLSDPKPDMNISSSNENDNNEKDTSWFSTTSRYGILFIAFYILILTLVFFFINQHNHRLEKDHDFEFIMDEQLQKLKRLQ